MTTTESSPVASSKTLETMEIIGHKAAEGTAFPTTADEVKNYLRGLSNRHLCYTINATDPKQYLPHVDINGKSHGRARSGILNLLSYKSDPDVVTKLLHKLEQECLDSSMTDDEVEAKCKAARDVLKSRIKALDKSSDPTTKALRKFASSSIPHYEYLRLVGLFDGTDNTYDYAVVNFYNYVVGNTKTDDHCPIAKGRRRCVRALVELLIKHGREPFTRALDVVYTLKSGDNPKKSKIIDESLLSAGGADQIRLLYLFANYVRLHEDKSNKQKANIAKVATFAMGVVDLDTLDNCRSEVRKFAADQSSKTLERLDADFKERLGASPQEAANLWWRTARNTAALSLKLHTSDVLNGLELSLATNYTPSTSKGLVSKAADRAITAKRLDVHKTKACTNFEKLADDTYKSSLVHIEALAAYHQEYSNLVIENQTLTQQLSKLNSPDVLTFIKILDKHFDEGHELGRQKGINDVIHSASSIASS
ncbi:MAG: hypothetical protein GY833_22405 [Aestuariibacter sp.]|nr:hypothetical protein [Aestuariibacter sp.]|tara:strand:+ start:271599 stop:273038 length:1440 start_codon:yes stop_codon:yes gene_type:complete